VPDALTGAPPIRALVWSLLGALVGLWLGYAIVAGMKQGSAAPQPAAAHAPPATETAPVGLALTAAPALRVRSSLFGSAPVRTVVRHAPRRRARAKATVAAPAPQTAMASGPTPVSTPAQTIPVQAAPAPAPAPRPAPTPKRQPTLTAQPKQPSGPSFDQSSPNGFDNSG
jgi:hypothetical protein